VKQKLSKTLSSNAWIKVKVKLSLCFN
jgi:hypothetical protein